MRSEYPLPCFMFLNVKVTQQLQICEFCLRFNRSNVELWPRCLPHLIGEHKYRRADECVRDRGRRKTKHKKKSIQTSCREIDMVIHLKDDGWVNKCCERRAARSLAARRDRRRTRLVRTGQEVQIAVGVDISWHRVLLNERGLVKKKLLHLILTVLIQTIEIHHHEINQSYHAAADCIFCHGNINFFYFLNFLNLQESLYFFVVKNSKS